MLAQSAEQRRMELQESFAKLSPSDRLLIELYSVIYEPVKIDSIKKCLAKLPKKFREKVNGDSTLSKSIRNLTKLRLLKKCQAQQYQCNPLIVEIITRSLVQNQSIQSFTKAVHLALPMALNWRGKPIIRSMGRLIREIRIGLYTHDIDHVELILENSPLPDLGLHDSHYDIIHEIIDNPFDGAWFQTLPDYFQIPIFYNNLNESVFTLTPAEEMFLLLENKVVEDDFNIALWPLLASQLFYRGMFSEVEILCEDPPLEYLKHHYLGVVAAVQGDHIRALEHFQASLKQKKKETSGSPIFLESLAGVLFILASMKCQDKGKVQIAKQQIHQMVQGKHIFSDVLEMLALIIDYQAGDILQREKIRHFKVLPLTAGNGISTLLIALGWYWVMPKEAKKLAPIIDEVLEQALRANYDWIAAESAYLLQKLEPNKEHLVRVKSLLATRQIVPMVDLIQPVEPWELCLTALTQLNQPESLSQPVVTVNRLVWFLNVNQHGWALIPKEQKINAKGTWSKGRVISLKRLAQSDQLDNFDYLSEQDRRICRCIESTYQDRYSYYYNVDYKLTDRALQELVGHPLVFWESAPDIRVEVVSGEPEILVKQTSADSLLLELSPPIKVGQSTIIQKETLTRVKVIPVKPEHERIAIILGSQNALTVPLEAKERVLEAINSISNLVTVHSDIGGGNESIEELPASSTPHLQLFPLNEGLNVKILIRPFGSVGPYFSPGQGGITVISEIEGVRKLTKRDLSAEIQSAEKIIQSCSVLKNISSENYEWILDEVEDCLEVLLSLQSLDSQLVLEWPEGEKFKLKPMFSLDQFRMSLKRQRDWFAVEGEIQLDSEQVLNIQQLILLLEKSKGRFLPLGDGQFLALTETFRKRLEELQAISEQSGSGRRLNPLASLALEDWLDEVGELQVDRHWQEHLQRLEQVRVLEPQLPSTLQAELRDYQIEGFQWLARLSAWGVGACLADDMGLGKTLQALAMILTRAPKGPTLVIAPTSVGMNWSTEVGRFAPTLNPIQLGSSNRQKQIENLQPFDLLICSYGLLQQPKVSQMLSEVQWQVVVLDEAQAIKNASTKRSKAAMKLQGEFKLLTTGTPIENHLGELWNLFRFITPGLLGSLEQFNQRFAYPIERDENLIAKHQLKKLIQPFILRRTKAEVLDELPSRTEIPLYVDLSPKEKELYEALRQTAIQTLSDSDAVAGTKHLQVLAEITKLRRCCCNPQLVVPSDILPGRCSKLEVFAEVLEELLANHHKALVFSQFVDHLAILRDFLDEKQVSYQYLDGSTPAKQRKARVEAFQAGEGDVFLISLKAGGTGLNLTAADYVIHMDPWWNPAVEDQASDRAHRIGQTRPVTIYRLITRNTIEEKIVDLHRQKRDLADSLLEGADMSGKISTEALLELIQK
ncbi:DEAD/DEAH box helicase [Lyngbya confervoides]|uniref:DEAD/DEAH box helicase n=1 Tax=Lyngbya confervoides BDU141951 TaxID=1574623 RepID=A0ABD4T7E3_9CYAN|nr:DEAD/DEAH box helicase [Lyngbya confervoides]MCM1984420.1 DEAD/DEAH box helicase [Lyngbya confervoides BDU141951]